MNDVYYDLPPEVWIKIIDYTNEIRLLFANSNFFELVNLINIKINVIEHIIKYENLYVIKYIDQLKKKLQ